MMSRASKNQKWKQAGFLNDLESWEVSSTKEMKRPSPQEKLQGSGAGKQGGDGIYAKKSPSADSYQSNAHQFNYSRIVKGANHLSSSLTEESSPSATSEKDLGNECFKQKKFKEAIDCYSRSIALSPTAVAFANRAMAYLKIQRFEEAENDCTEALDLDDRYIKAYSRRATARKELGKLKASLEDSEFALRLEPQNPELKKQHAEVKAMYDKELLEKASGMMNKSTKVAQRIEKNADYIKEVGSTGGRSRVEGYNGSKEDSTLRSGSKIAHGAKKRELMESIQELALRAASRATSEAEKNITEPKSAYQFEISWKKLSGDRVLQARLLKATVPSALPHLFKNSLSATLLIDIIKCISTFFKEETELAVKFLKSLTEVPRFDMIIMCLVPQDKSDLQKMWGEVFLNAQVPVEYVEILRELQPKYCLRG